MKDVVAAMILALWPGLVTAALTGWQHLRSGLRLVPCSRHVPVLGEMRCLRAEQESQVYYSEAPEARRCAARVDGEWKAVW